MEERTFDLKLLEKDISWVSAALSCYVADHDRSREEDYYRLEEQLGELQKEADLRAEAEENAELEESQKPEDGKLDVEVSDCDVDSLSNEEIEIDANGLIDAPFLSEYVYFEAKYSAAVEVEWEEDGEPTYVPYGDRQVMYDDGRGGIDSVSVSGGSIDEIEWRDEAGGELDEERVKELLRVDEEGLKEIVDRICGDIDSFAEIYAGEHEGEFERPEAEEPDSPEEI